ncbi:MAG: hypothetical protein ACOH5I_18130 [Oligoflexus sp.]
MTSCGDEETDISSEQESTEPPAEAFIETAALEDPANITPVAESEFDT